MLASTIYVTTNSHKEAKIIAEIVIREKLAACANIIGSVSSVFMWQGEVCEESETAIILKTVPALIDKLTRRIKEMHSYECPCIVALEIVGGNTDYIDWILNETKIRKSKT